MNNLGMRYHGRFPLPSYELTLNYWSSQVDALKHQEDWQRRLDKDERNDDR